MVSFYYLSNCRGIGDIHWYMLVACAIEMTFEHNFKLKSIEMRKGNVFIIACNYYEEL